MSAPEPKEEVNIFNPVNYGVKPDGTIEFAPLYSPHFSGNPTAPTPAVDNSSNRIATTSYVKRQGYVTDGDIGGTYLKISDASATYETQANASATYETQANASATYETQANASATYETQANATATYETQANATATYAPKASPALTGTPTTTIPPTGSNSLQIANTQWIRSEFYDQIQILSFLSAKANLASPQLTGTPTINNDNVATENYVTNQGYLTITDAGTTYAPIDNASFTGTSTFTKAKVSTRFLLMRATLASTDALLGSSAITAGNYLTTLNPGSVSSYALQQFTAGDSGSQSIIITSGGSFGQTKNTIQSYDSRRDSPLNLYLNPLGGNVHAPTEASTVNDTRIATTAFVQTVVGGRGFKPFYFNSSGTFLGDTVANVGNQYVLTGSLSFDFTNATNIFDNHKAAVYLRIRQNMEWQPDNGNLSSFSTVKYFQNRASNQSFVTLYPGRMASAGTWGPLPGQSGNQIIYLNNTGNNSVPAPWVTSSPSYGGSLYLTEQIYQNGTEVGNRSLLAATNQKVQFGCIGNWGYNGYCSISVEVLGVNNFMAATITYNESDAVATGGASSTYDNPLNDTIGGPGGIS